ncbi:hypothetical protein DPMN_038964 [Dreissena polymorpha]|uniref:Uncharacterized protein n=1 Tax=Dreissena polymorpha TaxID=45954 RepID=A0A9D4ME52_DREPO|nr:hypothetical protein DPMN_038964 [Dreissena polymorpha]
MATVRQYDGDNAIERWRHCDDTTATVRYDYRIVAPYSRGISITTPYCLFVRICDAFSIRSQTEVLRVIMSNILKLFCQGKSWTSYKPFYPAKLTVLVYRNQQRRDS